MVELLNLLHQLPILLDDLRVCVDGGYVNESGVHSQTADDVREVVSLDEDPSAELRVMERVENHMLEFDVVLVNNKLVERLSYVKNTYSNIGYDELEPIIAHDHS